MRRSRSFSVSQFLTTAWDACRISTGLAARGATSRPILGAMTAAQLFRAACQANADILPGLSKGDFAPLRTWLRANVHAKGSLMTTDHLLAAATGRPLTVEVFRTHLRERYLGC